MVYELPSKRDMGISGPVTSSGFCFATAIVVLFATTRSIAKPEGVPAASEAELATENVADERSRWFSDHPLVLQARGGVGTPVGLIGGTLILDVHDRVGFGVGAGTNAHGLQTAGLVRFRPMVWQGQNDLLRAVAIEFSVSVGPGSGGVLPAADGGEGNGLSYTWNRIAWAQLEGQYEVMKASGVSFLAGIGMAFPVAHSENASCRATLADVTCDNTQPPNGPEPALSISGAIGYAF
jgi:hypothetical protein